jgi:hypothetical protein
MYQAFVDVLTKTGVSGAEKLVFISGKRLCTSVRSV